MPRGKGAPFEQPVNHLLRGCMYFRDGDGFCLLANRCWSGKPCPKSQAEADLYREQLCTDYFAEREKAGT